MSGDRGRVLESSTGRMRKARERYHLRFGYLGRGRYKSRAPKDPFLDDRAQAIPTARPVGWRSGHWLFLPGPVPVQSSFYDERYAVIGVATAKRSTTASAPSCLPRWESWLNPSAWCMVSLPDHHNKSIRRFRQATYVPITAGVLCPSSLAALPLQPQVVDNR